ncbi:MAG: AraC family transcriptional regulator [Pseudomonadota bacterium]
MEWSEKNSIGQSAPNLPIIQEYLDVSAHNFADVTSMAWHVTPLQGPNGYGRVSGDLWVAGNWLFSDLSLPAVLFQVDTCHLVEASTHIDLERFVYGQESGRTNGTDAILNGPGRIQFFDRQHTFESVASDRRVQTISLPRERLGLPLDACVEGPDIDAASFVGEIVFAEWDALFHSLSANQGRLSQGQLDRFIACIKMAMGVAPEREDIRNHAREALFRKICRFIESQLDSPNLTTETLLHQFGASRATLYRMFEPMGGVRNYITHRRATSALAFIARSEEQRGVVKAACERWGFSSPANFNRTIQRLFGNNPTALLFSDDALIHETRTLSNFVEDYVAIRYEGAEKEMTELAA